MHKSSKKLPSQDYLNERLYYNSETGKLFWRYHPNQSPQWNGRWANQIAGYPNDGRNVIGINGSYYKTARIIWKMVTGKDPVQEIDHVNGNGFNDIWENLREASSNQNGYNKTMYKSNTTGFKGVFRKRNKFTAVIKVNSIPIRLGTFNTPEEAYEAYCKKGKELHGEFFNPG